MAGLNRLTAGLSLHWYPLSGAVKNHWLTTPQVTRAQVRAARGLLNWTVRDLAEKSGVHRNTATRVETEATAPGHSIAAIRSALESAGIIFLADSQSIDGGPGVRLAKRQVE